MMNLYPNDFKLEETTVWKFSERGSWATHNGRYRGNWSPYIPRNLILRYSKKGDKILDQFCGGFKKVVDESYRVLKKGKICALMIGDIRKNGKVVPLGFEVMNLFLKAGFRSKEIVIKEQSNLNKSDYWKNKKTRFLFLAHEYIFIFEK